MWDELRAAFEGMHALVNAYRPHQARESLIAEMEGWVGRGREEVRRMREAGERARGVLDRVGAGGKNGIRISQDDGGKTGDGGDVVWRGKGVAGEERRVERRVWKALHRLERSEVGC